MERGILLAVFLTIVGVVSLFAVSCGCDTGGKYDNLNESGWKYDYSVKCTSFHNTGSGTNDGDFTIKGTLYIPGSSVFTGSPTLDWAKITKLIANTITGTEADIIDLDVTGTLTAPNIDAATITLANITKADIGDLDVSGTVTVGQSLATGISIASGQYSVAEGSSTASGEGAHAEGASTASGDGAHSEGYSTASGVGAHAEGASTASGDGAHSEGYSTASEFLAHAEGSSTASGVGAHAQGYYTEAAGYYSTVFGRELIVNGDYTFGIALNDQNSVHVWPNNVMAILGGKVGIGTGTPTAELDVVGDIDVSGSATISTIDCNLTVAGTVNAAELGISGNATIGGNLDIIGNITGANLNTTVQALSDAGTVSWDMDSGRFATLTIAGSRTLENPTNAGTGSMARLMVTQSGGLGCQLAFDSNYLTPGGVTPVLSTGTGCVDLMEFLVEDPTTIYLVNVIYDLQ